MAQLFQRPLLATEHTEFDAGAERLALVMAHRCQTPLAVVLPLVSNPEYEALAPQIAAHAERAAASRIEQLKTQADAAGVVMKLGVRRGEEPYSEIVAQARAGASDLIIIRRRGKRSFLANLLVGEMVSKVVAHAPCHVLIVPKNAQMWQSCVLAAAKPGTQGRQVVSVAIDIAAQCALPLHLVSVISDEGMRSAVDTFLSEMLTLAQGRGVNAQGEVRVGKPYAEILAAENRRGADLIVMGSRGDQRIGRALVGGVAQKVMGLCEHPVLVLHL